MPAHPCKLFLLGSSREEFHGVQLTFHHLLIFAILCCNKTSVRAHRRNRTFQPFALQGREFGRRYTTSYLGTSPRCGNPTSERANGCSGNRKAAPRSFTNFWREATATFETLGSTKAALKGEVWGVTLRLCSSFLRVVVPDLLRPLSPRLLLVYIYVLVSLPFKKKTSHFHQPA